MKLFRWFRNQKSEDIPDLQIKASEGATVLDLNDVYRLYGSTSTELLAKVEVVFACLRDKSETIGQIPLRMFKSENTGRRQITSGYDWRVFTQKPCEYLTLQEWLEFLVVSLERWGQFACYIERNDRGRVSALIPFRHQQNVHPAMDVNGNIYYTYVKNDGSVGDPYRAEDLFIVRTFTFDGVTPVSPMQQTASNLGIANAQEQSQKETFENGITAQMALATDQVFSDENARRRIQEDWKSFRGPEGKKRIPILEQGLKVVNLKLTPAELDLLSNRKFTIDRVCRTFRVPLHRVGAGGSDKAVTNVFDLDEAYMRDSLNPVLTKVERALNELQRDGFTLSFDRNAFYAGSPWRLLTHVEKGVKGGLLTINQGRTILGWEPVEGGDVFAIDNNNVVYGFWSELKDMQERLYGTSNQQNQQQGNSNEQDPNTGN